MTNLDFAEEAEAKPVPRPLSALAKLIKKDLDAADAAGMEYYKAAGEKLIEAKGQLPHGEFGPWVKKHFKISAATSARYMAMASNLSHGINFKNQREFREKIRGEKSKSKGSNNNFDAITNDKEQELRRELALQVIDAGYKPIAKTLHPDKGGSDVAMARLNAVRDTLKSFYGKGRAQ